MRIICYNKTGRGTRNNSTNYGKLRGSKQFKTYFFFFCKYNVLNLYYIC